MNGEGVWILRYESVSDVPKDFARVSLAMNMDERCQVLREYGAKFYADLERIDELKR